jgi:DNA-binding CsgD family transcriptional regulator
MSHRKQGLRDPKNPDSQNDLEEQSKGKSDEIIRLREEQLATISRQLIDQSEKLDALRHALSDIIQRLPKSEPASRDLREVLLSLPHNSLESTRFDEQFVATYPSFRPRLKELYPELSQVEMRVCSLLRMNLKSPDIAKLLNLSVRTVENHRYNIRKKLGLDSKADIASFLAEIG